ncbi:MAG: pyridoxamine 5'-phosphate oxidase family protein [Brumimicrobium sp.]|nr:pyridoxamine 5'-phosphate oxidase family protein [Brumimicrobium sp.]
MSSPEHKKLIWDLIKNIKVGMLVTKERQDDEKLRARPMSLVQDAYDGTLYFFTSRDAAKVYEVKNDKDVCVTFSNPRENVYVSLTGKARFTQDKELIDRYWNNWVAAWYEDGKDDQNIGMLAVKINKGEHWDAKENKLVQLFEIAKANVLESATPNVGENDEFGTD